MKTILVMILYLAGGGSVEFRAPSLEACESIFYAIEHSGIVQLTDEYGEVLLVEGAECKAQELDHEIIEAGGEVM